MYSNRRNSKEVARVVGKKSDEKGEVSRHTEMESERETEFQEECFCFEKWVYFNG